MLKRLMKKITVLLCAAAMLAAASSCDFLIRRMNSDLPLESYAPQTLETIVLEVPDLQDGTIKPYFFGNEPDENPVRPLEQAEVTQTVTSQSELIAAAMKGKRPVFQKSSTLRGLYDSVLKVLNTIIQNDMTEYERALSIYDFLIYYTVYDLEILDKYINDYKSITGNENEFNLKGVFEDYSAVCDGFSKAFSLMCGIEGIKNARVTGEGLSEGNWLNHAWNKVLLEGKWYNVDPTYGNLIVKTQGGTGEHFDEYLTHSYFLVSDSEISADHRATKYETADMYLPSSLVSATGYGYYGNTEIEGYTVNTGTLLEPVYSPHNHVFNNEASLNEYTAYLRLYHINAAELYSTLAENTLANSAGMGGSVHKIRDNVYFFIFA